MSKEDNKPNIDFSISNEEQDSEIESEIDDMSIEDEIKKNDSDIDEFDDSDIDDDNNLQNNEELENIEDSAIEYNEIKNTNDYSDDDEDLEEDYLQKIDKNKYNEVLETFHPELKIYNIDEIKTLSIVLRDKDNNIIDPLHKTIPFITSYEKARIIGERTKQLNQGAQPFTEVEPDVIDGYLIALKEYKEKKIPFIIQRPLPNGTSEYWKFSDLEDI